MSRQGPIPAVLLLALATAFIIYGSLYPFRFAPLPPGIDAWHGFAQAWARPAGGRGDLVANVLLYMPFGLLAAASLHRWAVVPRLGLAILAGTTLSVLMEAAQLLHIGRTTSIWDVACNAAGTAAGAVLAALGAAHLLDRRPRVIEPLAALLVLAWIGYRFYPYVPAFDLAAWRDNLKWLLLSPAVEPVRTLRLLVSWTAAALLTEAAFGMRTARPLVPLGLAAGLAAEVLLPGKRLDMAEALAPGLALPAWVMLRKQSWAPAAMATGLAGAVLIERLEPFTFVGPPRDFSWIPFRSLIGGSRDAGVQAILAKLFLQGALLWWLLRARLGLLPAATLQAIMVLCASLAQTRLPGRSAEITDTLIVLGLALVFYMRPPVLVPPQLDASWRLRAAAVLERRTHLPRRRTGPAPE